MTSYLIDINVWLALTWRLHPASPVAHKWLATLAKEKTRLVFCRITQLGLLRLLTNEAVMGDSVLNIAQALLVFDQWCEDPRVELVTEPKGMEPAFRHAAEEFAKRAATKVLPARKVLMDAYLCGFAETEQATLVTLDKPLIKLAQRRGVMHTLLSIH